MKKIIILLLPISLALGGCQNLTRADKGALLGGVIGAAVGNHIGDGMGRNLATAAGLFIGSAVGASVGAQLDDYDHLQAQHALEHNKTGESLSWINPDSDHSVEVTPTRTYQSASTGRYCREYTTTVIVGGQPEEAYGTACRQPDGSWQIMN